MNELVKKEATELAKVDWKERLAQYATKAAEVEKSAGIVTGQFFSTKSGVLSWQGNPIKDNKMICIIVHHCIEYSYYTSAYKPGVISSPDCYAFGYDAKTLSPHSDAVNKQSELCDNCPKNEWGSKLEANGKPGKGKACSNSRRLALLPAGVLQGEKEPMLFNKPEDFDADIGFLRLPVTSTGVFAKYVNDLSVQLSMPSFAVYTLIALEPDQKTLYKFSFKGVKVIEDEALLSKIFSRMQEAEKTIQQPYMNTERSEDK